ncbi:MULTISPECIES: UdgX family uracil-DNA binding protein [Rhodomicrobium]|uniref:UdgX family uracil-DNA binding protein n=1 Tax=Rhodomicrobium vannielii TaxID=1069 RepID=UPI000B4B79D4
MDHKLHAPSRKSDPPAQAEFALGGPAAPARATLDALRAEAAQCRRCPLWEPATQTVFGEGPADAAMMVVGEQPGDQEDLAGHPFVGPAGAVFDKALGAADIDRAGIYVTNAVKHFKFEPRGKRRLHQTPNPNEIKACRWWLEQEVRLIRPRVIVAMGATAARSVLGRAVRLMAERGKPIPGEHGAVVLTVHPSYLLRLPDETAKREQYDAFVRDLREAARLARG